MLIPESRFNPLKKQVFLLLHTNIPLQEITTDYLFAGNIMPHIRPGKHNAGSDTDTESADDLARIRDAIIRELEDVVSIYLFGSLARGTSDPSSDYDIVVIVKEVPGAYIGTISAIRYSLLGKTRRPVDIIILDAEDLDTVSPLIFEILQHNRLLHGRDVLSRISRDVPRVHPIIMDGATVGYHV